MKKKKPVLRPKTQLSAIPINSSRKRPSKMAYLPPFEDLPVDQDFQEQQINELKYRLEQLKLEYESEEQRKQSIIEKIHLTKQRVSSDYTKTSVAHDVQYRMDELQADLEQNELRYTNNLVKLEELRHNINEIRQEVHPEQFMDRFIQDIFSKGGIHIFSNETSSGHQASPVFSEKMDQMFDFFEKNSNAILECVGVETMPEMFAEATRLESENQKFSIKEKELIARRDSLQKEVDNLNNMFSCISNRLISDQVQQEKEYARLEEELKRLRSRIDYSEEDVFREISLLTKSLDIKPSFENITDEGSALAALDLIESAIAPQH